jgi:hypothetical protein
MEWSEFTEFIVEAGSSQDTGNHAGVKVAGNEYKVAMAQDPSEVGGANGEAVGEAVGEGCEEGGGWATREDREAWDCGGVGNCACIIVVCGGEKG